MKKLFSTLGMMALVSLCLFSSCKDEDYPATAGTPIATVDKAQASAAQNAGAANAANEIAQAAAPSGATVVGTPTTVGNTTTTNYSDGTKVETTTGKADANGTATSTVVVTNPDGTTEETTVVTSYTYEVNGVTYKSLDEAMAALKGLPAGSVAQIVATLTQTTTTITKDNTGKVVDTKKEDPKTKSTTSEVKIPETGQTSKDAIVIPTSVTTDATASVDVTVQTTEKPVHSGGSAK